jgi:hypothetical protein
MVQHLHRRTEEEHENLCQDSQTQTEHLLITNLEGYLYTNLLGEKSLPHKQDPSNPA